MVDFQQVVAVDQRMDLFSRAWCVAELVEARRLMLKQTLVVSWARGGQAYESQKLRIRGQ